MDIRTRLFTVFMGIAFSFTAMLVFEHVLESRRMAFEAAEVKAEAVADLVTGLSLQNIETGEPGRLKELRPLIARFRQIIYLQVQDVKGHTLFMYANPGIKLEGRTSDVSVDKVADGVFDMERDLMSNNRSYGRLKLGVETGPVRKIVENVFWRAGFMGACFLTVFALVFWAASSRLAGDMRLLTEAAGKINDAELPALPAAAASSDIGKLSTAFREYHDTIAEERGLRKETEELGHDFFAMTVHDLKQPITVLKAANDLILEAIEGGAGSKKDLGQ
ncbi:MAG TPA: hypothetical protein PKI19_08700, partial [Elusimicrobiales bacterium]|nr:hypothetical protein [Elusimicrobiales bacterium]